MPKAVPLLFLGVLSVLLAAGAPAASPSLPPGEGRGEGGSPSPATHPATRPAGVVSQQLLADLDSNSFEVREKASAQLLADDSLTPQALADAYAAATSPEQHQRLSEIARHHFLRTARREVFGAGGRGSIGISLRGFTADDSPVPGTPTATVNATFAGFPSFTALREGDALLGVDGKTLDNQTNGSLVADQFKGWIMEHKSGQTVTLSVSRDGKTIAVPLQLVNSAALLGMYDPNTGSLQGPIAEAWESYRAQLEALRKPGEEIKLDWAKVKEELGAQRDQQPIVP